MAELSQQLAGAEGLHHVVVPDLWQQEAVAALREGKDVVVQAPTGSGKTLIFELWSDYGKNRGQAIYTVPTRALANDKLAEWRARGWDVGIATGDLAENLDAPVVVATLETQKNRLLHGHGPSLLVVDEYQLIGDPDRGLNYELALALAPPQTQLLLLSGSVANPGDVVKWLERIGRQAVLIRHEERSVPLDEVHGATLNYQVPSEIKGYWPRLIAKALAEDLGPILIFAPQRRTAESLAGDLARQLPNPHPLQLSAEQKRVAGDRMTKLLKARVAYHHSGLSYSARAGVVEPLAKAGQLRVVVATMGLAAGINFSLRSVALAGDSYIRDGLECPLRPDEILQMFGRAGRRGIDEMGYILITANEIRLREAFPVHLSRSRIVDWAALLRIMAEGADTGCGPFAEAVRIQRRLFTAKPILLGVEESLKHPTAPCGLQADSERARHVRQSVVEILNSRGEWERKPRPELRRMREVSVINEAPEGVFDRLKHLPRAEEAPNAKAAFSVDSSASGEPLSPLWTPGMHPALQDPQALERVGPGELVWLSPDDYPGRASQPESPDGGVPADGGCYARRLTIGEILPQGRVRLVKWIRRLTRWHSRVVPPAVWRKRFRPLLEKKLTERGLRLLWIERREGHWVGYLDLAGTSIRVPVDRHGIALWRPPIREVLPDDCAVCPLVPTCSELSPASGVAMLWRRLGLVDHQGVPTRRGRIVSFFSQGYGLAIAAAAEDPHYPIEQLVYDLANLEGGFRFCGEENRWGGRLAVSCHKAYGRRTIPGYLEHGLPPKYGAGAEEVVASVYESPQTKHRWVSEAVGPGDIDRIFIEWRSLLRQIVRAPSLGDPRWSALQTEARSKLEETESPTVTDLPPLEYFQTRRIGHKLILRRS